MTIPALFAAQVAHCADDTAVVQDDISLTYGELGRLVASHVTALRAAGVTPGARVGLLCGRSILGVAAQLATVSIGAAFVPLDPAGPKVAATVAGEAEIAALVCSPDLAGLAKEVAPRGCPVLPLTLIADETACFVPDPGLRADDLAYVIYTSGSTGRPKGVMVAHRGVCRLVRGQSYADLGPDQVMLNMAAVGFDASIGEIYSALLNGGRLVILPDAVPSLDRIAQVIADHGVTIAYVTAGLFHVIAERDPRILAPLQQVFPCGDVLSQPHVERMRAALPDLRMINGYGPTENTVFTCCFPIDDRWDGGPVPIGYGLAGDRLLVLDEARAPVADGTIGQLAVGGPGVALGYLGRPDLTAAAFVPVPGQDGLFYLTGDLVVRDAGGLIRFHGRADRQIKINGQRVELDSVEHALRADPAIRDAAALAARREDGSRRIVAFVVADAGTTVEAVLAGLRTRLPEAAVPARIDLRDALPLSGSGKVDRKRLAAELDAPRPARAAAPADAGLRATIRAVWSEVLEREIPDTEATFFDLGGTSLQLIAAHAALQARLGRTFEIAKLFQAPRLRDLERLLGEAPAIDAVAAQRMRMARRRGQG
ncbi:non-ribosomal peptide synthetase [Jannaschia marina]|uniref:non-ribosomal peptide synthetase n=1 Tax=Jannaschia marina TaxID=2741674 RepID=UPI0015C6C86C|nr:non-ribosomal peptide synthetase [Jannaschia marina]